MADQGLYTAPNQGFTVFAVDSPRALRTIKVKLTASRNALAESIAEGSVTDWAHYQRSVGTIAGLDEAIRLCEEIEKQERQ